MSKKKQLYHSELSQLGWVWVTLKSDVLPSKFKQGSFFIDLLLHGSSGAEERTYTIENNACGAVLRGRMNQQIQIKAEGQRDSATIAIADGAPAAVAQAYQPPQQPPGPPPQQYQQPPPGPPPQQHYQQSPPQQHAAPPPQQTAPAKPDAMPVWGQTVGMAINNACEFMRQQGKPWDPKECWEVASAIIRVSRHLEAGKLAPKPGGVPQQPTAPAQPPVAATPPQPAGPAVQDRPVDPSDDIPF